MSKGPDMKYVILLLSVLTFYVRADTFPVVFGNASNTHVLTIYSAVDLDSFGPLLKQFSAENPDLQVRYFDINTLELYHKVIDEREAPVGDLIISSAMDLQLKLVNDGYAQTYKSTNTESLPDNAKWRNQIFSFSLEPVVILVNNTLFPDKAFPQDRQSLLQSIRRYSDKFDGKIGTYDIRTSGVGYMLASQDARQADATWGRLLEAFGNHNLQTYCCTSQIIDDIASGKLILGYNLLGAYAYRRALNNPKLTMIMPSDYTLLLRRTALIPKNAPHAEDAGRFLDFLLSNEGRRTIFTQSLLFPIDVNYSSKNVVSATNSTHPMRLIELDQQLLVGRDIAKESKFIKSWEVALELNSEE